MPRTQGDCSFWDTWSTHRQSSDTKYKLPLLTSLFILAMTATSLGATSDYSEGVLSPAVVQGVRSRDVRERWSGAVDRSVLSHQTGRGRGPWGEASRIRKHHGDLASVLKSHGLDPQVLVQGCLSCKKTHTAGKPTAVSFRGFLRQVHLLAASLSHR